MAIRKTIDIEDGLHALIKEEAKRTGETMSTVFNRIVRAGLEARKELQRK